MQQSELCTTTRVPAAHLSGSQKPQTQSNPVWLGEATSQAAAPMQAPLSKVSPNTNAMGFSPTTLSFNPALQHRCLHSHQTIPHTLAAHSQYNSRHNSKPTSEPRPESRPTNSDPPSIRNVPSNTLVYTIAQHSTARHISQQAFAAVRPS